MARKNPKGPALAPRRPPAKRDAHFLMPMGYADLLAVMKWHLPMARVRAALAVSR
jgi:hypothetical protein